MPKNGPNSGSREESLTAAQANLKAAVLDIQGVRTAWFEAVRGLEGALQHKFTTDRARIDSFFPERSVRAKVKAAVPAETVGA